MAQHAANTPNRIIPSPEARRYVYLVALALVPVLVAYGLLTGAQAELWLKVLEAVLGMAPLALAAANVPKGGSGA